MATKQTETKQEEPKLSTYQVKTMGGITFEENKGGHVGYKGLIQLDPNLPSVQQMVKAGKLKPTDEEPAPSGSTVQKAESAEPKTETKTDAKTSS